MNVNKKLSVHQRTGLQKSALHHDLQEYELNKRKLQKSANSVFPLYRPPLYCLYQPLTVWESNGRPIALL